MNTNQELHDYVAANMAGAWTNDNPTVLTWLNELEQGPWLDVTAEDFRRWVARYKLAGRLYKARDELVSDAQSASHMMHQTWNRREGLLLSDSDIRTHLADAVANPVTASAPISFTARDDLLAIARPNVPRWQNANWNIQPGLGDVENARNV